MGKMENPGALAGATGANQRRKDIVPAIYPKLANLASLKELLRIPRLVNRYGRTPAQAAVVAGLA